ncbi:putative radical SAM family enzyme, NOT coproporphyrinogen III oxidase, oxygen-independent [Mesoflavibacter sp. HG96]|uniref:radical SAM family heme chaperone HemW n=1 Tax=Mesoflavibacter TaxID=444051 RepID=UPI000D103AC7|nr:MULTISPECIES: radical SAM family heme chaperone HemW [Mesoflavibacter]QIJ88571.1 putative radical SAM family enzyme, NOT coproporphyrinogen III oxidase, oxygen-independent [Mesoflavibacter sp. HG96]QIJ91299.1 putative radical SAM family enzyme, NOT coproporphyrinogen III oxidase, oxygen-independent [Mesoflavibacter sp. HG37]
MSGIYIHIPFCKQACYYCDFHFSTSLKKKDQLISALAKELQLRKDEFKNTTVETIYFGGGTPSLLSIEELQFLIDTVHKNYAVVTSPEVTLEANPDDLSEEKIIELSQSPINRLSIGIQSFFEKDLKLMNRAHNVAEAKKCLEIATQYFDNISLDLIYGIPNSTSKEWLDNIKTALSFGVPHISSYALTVEPKTALANFIDKGIIDDVDDEVAHQQFHQLIEQLEEAGFEHYELSNFAKPGYYSKNNSAYWLGKPYIGIGPSAHSFNGDQRAWNVKNNSVYIKKIEANQLPLEIETLSQNDKYNEFVMTGLRTSWGISLKTISSRFGDHYKDFLLNQAQFYITKHLLYIDNDSLKATKKGKFLTDGIASELFMLN